MQRASNEYRFNGHCCATTGSRGKIESRLWPMSPQRTQKPRHESLSSDEMYGLYVLRVKEKHPEYFQKLNAMKMELSKRKAAINDLDTQVASMENFSTKSEYHFNYKKSNSAYV